MAKVTFEVFVNSNYQHKFLKPRMMLYHRCVFRPVSYFNVCSYSSFFYIQYFLFRLVLDLVLYFISVFCSFYILRGNAFVSALLSVGTALGRSDWNCFFRTCYNCVILSSLNVILFKFSPSSQDWPWSSRMSLLDRIGKKDCVENTPSIRAESSLFFFDVF
ncbi:hypothetical protein DFS34DRAFT_487050 [Phlyctochytrium arcticum]|nr:hypothetical protein DFS34DRAFT_487050 [Phlyctochytrium arcticum]